eukprot:11450042-Alexandrium_andersonii.AAC.1
MPPRPVVFKVASGRCWSAWSRSGRPPRWCTCCASTSGGRIWAMARFRRASFGGSARLAVCLLYTSPSPRD